MLTQSIVVGRWGVRPYAQAVKRKQKFLDRQEPFFYVRPFGKQEILTM